MARDKREILTGVEIGTSTVKVVMGEFLPDDVLSIVGIGETPSLKVVKGEVVDVDVVQEQLERALVMAEHASDTEIVGQIFLAATGAHLKTVNSVGSTLTRDPNRRIGEEDVIAATKNARGYTLPADREVLHYLNRFYRIMNSREVTKAIGMVGSRLEADVHIIYGQHDRLETNCSMIADIMGFPATDIAFSGIAAAFAAFGPEETEEGALLIDVGAGVTEYVLMHGPGAFHSGQITVGTEHIVNDLSIGLDLPVEKCRKILKDFDQFGSAVMTPDERSRLMAVETLGQKTRHIPISTVEQIIELRLKELFKVILDDLREHDALGRIGRGIHIAGGGGYIPDIDRLAQHVFNMPVGIAKPRMLSGDEKLLDSPNFMTSIGLLRLGNLMLQIESPPPVPVWKQVSTDVRRAARVLKNSFRW